MSATQRRHPDATPWHAAPVVIVHRPACPWCWSPRFSIIRSEANGDGSTTRKAVCRCCRRRFKICVEPLPEIGK